MDAQYLTSFIDQHFDTMFERSGKGLTQLWLQDGDPSQNSESACNAMAHCHSEVLKILPQSPDLNPIEHIFHIVSRKLKKDVIDQKITCGSYQEFCNSVENNL